MNNIDCWVTNATRLYTSASRLRVVTQVRVGCDGGVSGEGWERSYGKVLELLEEVGLESRLKEDSKGYWWRESRSQFQVEGYEQRKQSGRV